MHELVYTQMDTARTHVIGSNKDQVLNAHECNSWPAPN
jgi:hypothetical protein